MSRKLTTEEWVARAKNKHGDTFDYSETIYIDAHTPLTVRCRRHGPFSQLPQPHIAASKETACPACYKEWSSKRQAFTTEKFIERAKEVHGDTFDYSKVEYVNMYVKVTIGCRQHGDFTQTPSNHLTRKAGCPKCAADATSARCRMTLDEFLRRAKEVHGTKYDYSRVVLKTSVEDIEIGCPKHGPFWQTPVTHITVGCGCPRCGYENAPGAPKRPADSVFRQLMAVHKGKYTPVMETYKAVRFPMGMVCPKHGPWASLTFNLLNGTGCPRCQTSKPQERVTELVDELTYGNFLSNTRKFIGGSELDVYVPDKKVAFEIHGLHWHSTTGPRGRKGDDWATTHQIEKLHRCDQDGIHLVQFYEDEVTKRWAAVNQHIRQCLGCVPKLKGEQKIYRVKRVDAEPFHSLYGFSLQPMSGVTFGLYVDDEPAIMVSANLPKDGEILLHHITCKDRVDGGLRKVLEAIQETLRCNRMVYFAEARLNNRVLYESAGFKDEGTSEPGYFFSKGSKRIRPGALRRQDFPKKVADLYVDSLSPEENWQNLGLPLVFNCGLTKWTMLLQ